MSHSPLLLQLVVILGTARLLGLALRYCGQPAVIGEMAAGLLLGPLVLGALAPNFQTILFEPASLPPLASLSQLGLVLFMFIVGAELRLPSGAGSMLASAGRVGVLSVVLPMALGFLGGLAMYPQLAPPGVGRWPFTLFVAVALSITAFPVMARILKDRRMTQTSTGRLALASAAVADVLAWIVLALVIVLAGSAQDWGRFTRILIGLVVFVSVIFGVLRPLMSWLITRYATDGRPTGMLLATLLIGTFACAYVSDRLQMHAVFGAFLFGACLPRDDRLLHSLIERIEHVAILVLMPIFFALAGLNTTPDAFGGSGIGALLLILTIAIVGKIGGGALGARISGLPWRASLAIGSLMNARGLMELIVMRVGLDIGVIGHELFTMLLIMAIFTTLMTSPLLSVFAGRRNADETLKQPVS